MPPDPLGDTTVVADEAWLVGVIANEGVLAGLRVFDAPVPFEAPPELPCRIHVRLRFPGATASNFPDQRESAALLATESQIVAAVGNRGRFVAAVTAPGFRDLIFYVATPQAVTDAVGTISIPEPLDGPHFDVDDDPTWRHFRALRSDAWQANEDRRRVVELADPQSHDLVESDVIHRFSFPDAVTADHARFAFAEVGVVATRLSAIDGGDPDAVDLEVREREELSQAEVARSRDALSAFAAVHGGRYVGWRVADAAPD